MLVRCLPAVLVLLLGPALPGHAQAPSEAEHATRVPALVASYDSAWNRRDTAVVGKLLAPRNQYFTTRGGVSTRAETLAFLGARDYVLEHAERSEVAISVSGPVAVVSSRWRGRGSYRGEAFEDDQRCGQTWLRSGAVWQLLSEHCVQITLAPAPPG